MHDPWIDDTGFTDDAYDDADDHTIDPRGSKRNRDRQRPQKRNRKKDRNAEATRKPVRVEGRDGTFRCRHCKTMVGLPISGGRHRNHCPLCLYSRHVDGRRPGDRRSDCRSMMVAIGLYARHNGEQVVVHECLGCGVVRHNRVAADDNVVQVMRLPVVPYEPVARDESAPERTA